MIKVGGFDFIPIHNFVPSIQKNTFGKITEQNPVGDIKTLGPERYISLATGTKDNQYNNNYQPTAQQYKNKIKTGANNPTNTVTSTNSQQSEGFEGNFGRGY